MNLSTIERDIKHVKVTIGTNILYKKHIILLLYRPCSRFISEKKIKAIAPAPQEIEKSFCSWKKSISNANKTTNTAPKIDPLIGLEVCFNIIIVPKRKNIRQHHIDCPMFKTNCSNSS